MENSQFVRLEDMVAVAKREASEARNLAEKAMSQIVSHESLCSERYNNISKQLNSLPDIYKTLNNLSATANRAVGMWLGVTGIGVIVGIFYTLIKIGHGG